MLRSALLCSVMMSALMMNAQAQTPSGAAPPAAAPPIVAAPSGPTKVNGVAITDAEMDAAKTELTEALAGLPPEQQREQLADYLVTLKLLSNEARKQKLDAGAAYTARLAFITDKMLMESLLRKEIDKTVTKEAIDAFYKERVKSMEPEQEVKARHILLQTEEEAKAAIAELKKGKDFAELAKTLSKDPGSAKEGGDLGYFTKDRMVPEFAEAAFKGESGQLLPEPVKSQFGWHVIKVEDKRKQAVPAMSDVEEQIRNFLNRKAQADLVTKLRNEAKIEKPPETQSEKPKN